MPLTWDDYAAGRSCPFDAPRPDYSADFCLIGKLAVSSLYLDRNQTYRGHSVLIYDAAHVCSIDRLAADAWAALSADLHAATVAVTAAVLPDHLNVASLGNVVPHLHWHIVPRYKSDPRWGRPIWSSDMPVNRLEDREYAELARKIGAGLGARRAPSARP